VKNCLPNSLHRSVLEKKPPCSYNEMCLYLKLDKQSKSLRKRINHILNPKSPPPSTSVLAGFTSLAPAGSSAIPSIFRHTDSRMYIYPTISDSICDGNNVSQRIANVFITAIAFILISLLLMEYLCDSAGDKERFLGYYISGILSLICLVFVPLFPNNAIRMPERGWNFLSPNLHTVGIAITVILESVSTTIYISKLQSANPVVYVFYALFWFFFAWVAVLYVLTSIPLYKPQFFSSNTSAIFDCLLYITETGLLLSLLFCYMFTVRHLGENQNFACP
jgi:hypothetical protein